MMTPRTVSNDRNLCAPMVAMACPKLSRTLYSSKNVDLPFLDGLLGAEGHDGVEVGGAVGRVNAENQPDACRNQQGEDDRPDWH